MPEPTVDSKESIVRFTGDGVWRVGGRISKQTAHLKSSRRGTNGTNAASPCGRYSPMVAPLGAWFVSMLQRFLIWRWGLFLLSFGMENGRCWPFWLRASYHLYVEWQIFFIFCVLRYKFASRRPLKATSPRLAVCSSVACRPGKERSLLINLVSAPGQPKNLWLEPGWFSS